VVIRFGQLTMLDSLKIMGFKKKRYSQWWNILKEEGGRLTLGDWMRLVILALRGLTNKEKGVGFSGKMLGCHRCLLFDMEEKKCGEGDVGCGCYMPFKIALGGDCWANEQGVEEECVGWDEGRTK